MNQTISLITMKTSIGFMYWLHETNDLRGLKGCPIKEYPFKISQLEKEYKLKYPNGLTGWTKEE